LFNLRIDRLELTRRNFIRLGAAGTAAFASLVAGAAPAHRLARASAALEPYFTAQADFRDVSRGQPLPHSLPEQQRRQVGLTRETWHLEVVSDPDHPATVRHPLTQRDETWLDFAGLMQLAGKYAVRFAKTMTCLNIGCPLGTGIWEGVPLREVV